MENGEREQLVLKGNGFISMDSSSHHAFNVFLDKIDEDVKGMCITREHPSRIKEMYTGNFSLLWLNQKKQFKSKKLFEDVEKKILQFLKNSPNGTILMERVDYLINLYGFDTFLKFVYSINEEIMDSESIMIFHVNPKVLSEKEQHLLQLELKQLPKPGELDQLKLAKDLFDILELVKETETKISFKSVCKSLSITKATARKRIYELERRKLILIKKDGRSKIVELSPEGQAML